MFWNIIRWGGTLVVLAAMIAAPFLAAQHEEIANPVLPEETRSQQSKNFNLQ